MTLLWAIPALPLLGAVVLGLAGPALGNRLCAVIGTGSVGLAAVLALCLAAHWLHQPPPGDVMVQNLWDWVNLPGLRIRFSLYLDPLALLMVLVITVIGGLIHLFSTAYMAGEAGYARYFAYLNLFVAAMLLLVLAGDLAGLFIGWEGVGVCSYLLVGFWFSDAGNGAAAQKSFIVTRIADIPLLLGLLLISAQLGTLTIHDVLAAPWPAGSIMPEVAAALLLVGGLGKSAQVPLHSWLPDAMAGPTPVSALIHAATMVTAGVYLVVRMHPLFLLAPVVMQAIAIGGLVTLLLAAGAGLFQRDIKRVLAYSTMSQIGYMFVALGVGAWPAAMFHLLTHAVFKALLFLSAGAVTMRLHHEQDIFKMGGLRRELPGACAGFVVGAASLAALPLVSAGFFSKEMILSALWAAPRQVLWAAPRPGLWAAALTGALLTAVYSFRLIFTVFFGPVVTPVSGRYGLRILLPLAALGLAALSIGWIETPDVLGGRHWLSDFLALGARAAGPVPALVPLAGGAVPLFGVGIAWQLHRTGFWRAQAAQTPSPLVRFLRAGCGFDAAYRAALVRPYLWLAAALRDDPVDLVSTALERAAIAAHARLRATQTGQLRRYAAWMMAGAIATIAMVLFA